MVRAPKLRVGYFAQHQIEELRPESSALQHLAEVLPDLREQQLRARLGGFGLTQDKAELPAALLSGGEKARLTLALISALEPQILVLDEPTNHLDIDSRDALIEAVNEFPGAVLLISHDRNLIELTADRLWLVAGGRVRPYDGDLADYHRSLLAGPADERPRGGERRAEPEARPAPARRRAAGRAGAPAPGRERGGARARAAERGSGEARRAACGRRHLRALRRRDRRADQARGRAQGRDRRRRAPLARRRRGPGARPRVAPLHARSGR